MKAIDLFAGLGGFSAGAQLAGHHVVWAANHWRAAVDVHCFENEWTTGGEVMRRVGKHAAGRLLDGVEHNGVPA